MLTAAARRSVPGRWDDRVCSRAQLRARGWTDHAIRAQLAAHRWQQDGRAVVLHNGPLAPEERWTVALINHGPRSALTSFTGAQALGLQGWERDEVHVVVPGGARVIRAADTVTHWSGDWDRLPRHAVRPTVPLPTALVAAAVSFASARPACGVLAAGVQQRLVGPEPLRAAIRVMPRARHRRQLLLALDDIAQGAAALSEIDFRRLCHSHGLPPPEHQAVRVEPSGRRRYLDVTWRARTGRTVIAEVDGAIHLAVSRWTADQLRQNELMIAGEPMLRFPSIVVRAEEALVADQIRRALDAW